MNTGKRKAMEKLINDFFKAMDSSGVNAKYYNDMFSSMSLNQFDKYFKGFFEDEFAYLRLHVTDFEHTVTMENIIAGAKVLKIPLFEYVYFRHLEYGKVVVSKERVPVGYLFIKRPQQTIAKKNAASISIESRSSLTSQVTGEDKNGRESDLENILLTSWGLKNAQRELNGPRSDDMVMKQQMLKDIALNGYCRLSDMEDSIYNKTTLNTVNVFFLGMSLNTDLVTDGLLLNNLEKKATNRLENVQ